MIDVTTIVVAIVTLLIAVITAFAVPWLKSHTTAVQQENIERWVWVAVQAAEQMAAAKGWKGADKLKYVQDALAKRKIKLDSDTLLSHIEAAVKGMNMVNTTTSDPNVVIGLPDASYTLEAVGDVIHITGGKTNSVFSEGETPTCQLVNELAKREGVKEVAVAPYEDGKVELDGPARILVVTD